MEAEKLNRLNQLNKSFIKSRQVCPPDEYQMRQNSLLYEIAIFLLEELDVYEQIEYEKKLKESR